MAFNLSTSIQRVGLAAAGTAIAALSGFGAVKPAHAFNIVEGVPISGVTSGDAGQTPNSAATITAPIEFLPNSNSITGALIEFPLLRIDDRADLYRFTLPSFSPGFIFQALAGPTAISGLANPRLYLFESLGGNQVKALSSLTGGTPAIAPTLLEASKTYFLGIAGQTYLPTINASNVLSWSGTGTYGGYLINATYTPVPEPFTMLGGAAALGVGGLMQRKRKKRQLAAQKVD